MRTTILSCALFLLCLGLVRPLYAADADASACLEEIKTACMGLEEHLETCLAGRAKQLSAPCRDLLSNAVSMAGATDGPGVCINDVKKFCPNLDGNVLAQCVMDKKESFSPACRSYLDAAANQPAPSK